MKKDNKHVIFDIDGVLVDSFRANEESLIETIHQFGFTFDNSHTLKSPIPTTKKLQYLEEMQGRRLSEEGKEKFLRVKFELLLQYFDLIIVNPHAVECIQKLYKSGAIISIASNARKEYIDLILNKLEVSHMISNIVGNDAGIQSKPSPDMFLHLAKLTDIPINDTLVVDDLDENIISARCAGFKTLAIPFFEEILRTIE